MPPLAYWWLYIPSPLRPEGLVTSSLNPHLNDEEMILQREEEVSQFAIIGFSAISWQLLLLQCWCSMVWIWGGWSSTKRSFLWFCGNSSCNCWWIVSREGYLEEMKSSSFDMSDVKFLFKQISKGRGGEMREWMTTQYFWVLVRQELSFTQCHWPGTNSSGNGENKLPR